MCPCLTCASNHAHRRSPSEDQPDESILKLSDAFPEGAQGDIEVSVRMLNINVGRNAELASACKPLMEYTWIIDHVRSYSKVMSVEDAVDKTITEMPDSCLLKTFLVKHKGEVKGMILTEYNEEEVMNGFKEEAYNDGMEKGMEKARLDAIINMMKKLKLSAEQVMDILNIPAEKHNDYKAAIGL